MTKKHLTYQNMVRKKLTPPDEYLCKRERRERPIMTFPIEAFACDICGRAVIGDKATPFLHNSCSLKIFTRNVKATTRGGLNITQVNP